jgi:mevalonate kinase
MSEKTIEAWPSFETRVPGKWVLAGEHAVLKGHSSVAIPHAELGLRLGFKPGASDRGLRVSPSETQHVIDEILTLALAGVPSAQWPAGELKIESTLPVGAGLGSSAALCVAVTRWLAASPLAAKLNGVELTAAFATRLEHHFHGKSSGMDVSVIAANKPVIFARVSGAQELGVSRLPRFTFHDTGVRARTSDCVAHVERFRSEEPVLGARLDELMGQAANESVEALRLYDAGQAEQGVRALASAMAKAQSCFDAWELVPPEARALLNNLHAEGARAAKLTGAGGGGMIVALWAPTV